MSDAVQERLTALCDNATVAIFMTDTKFHCTFMNRAAEMLTGATVAEIGTRPLGQFSLGKERLFNLDAQDVSKLKGFRQAKGETQIKDREGTIHDIGYTASPIFKLDRFVGIIVEVRDISEQKLNEARQATLLDELNHRVKNMLATVQSLSMNTMRSSQTVAEFHTNFQSRLLSLSRAHALLTSEAWDGVHLYDLARLTLSAFADRHSIGGPLVRLRPNAAVTLNMVFHELATNATKYGALSVPLGRVELWWEASNDTLTVNWRESGGPVVKPPTKTGFGTKLIKSAAAREFNADSQMTFASTGIECKLDIPLERIGTLLKI